MPTRSPPKWLDDFTRITKARIRIKSKDIVGTHRIEIVIEIEISLNPAANINKRRAPHCTVGGNRVKSLKTQINPTFCRSFVEERAGNRLM